LGKLQSFVDKFLPTRYVTKTGEPTLNSRGEPRVEARHINTKALLECESKAERKMLLDNMADFAVQNCCRPERTKEGEEEGEKQSQHCRRPQG
ncbi:hypothetical protein A2U01_0055329, partial [Trifolium medium]|nr:hypothetical protein [Trifolium medium]